MTIKLSTLLPSALLMLCQPLLAVAEQAQQPSAPPPQYYWPGPWHHMWGAGWGLPWGFFLLMIVLCIVFFAIGRRSGGAPHHWGPPWHMTERPWGPGRPWGDPTHTALQILNERFAKGEIQKTEYEEKKAAILSGGRT